MPPYFIYNVRYSAVPTNYLLLTIILYSSVKRHPFITMQNNRSHDVMNAFDCISQKILSTKEDELNSCLPEV